MAQAIADEELVEPSLPDATSVGAARHIPSDEEKVAIAIRVVRGEVPKLRQPRGDDGIEEATIGVVHVRRGPIVVGATHVSGSLVRENCGADGRDDTVGV